MTEPEELEQIENEIADLGRQVDVKRRRALEILGGRVAIIRGHRFRISRAVPYFGGSALRLFFTGKVLKQNGEESARHEESAPLRSIDKIEPRE